MTLELPWRNNEHDISRIPPGAYPYEMRAGNPRIFLSNVESRTGIQLHIGNYMKDTNGCILLGFGLHYSLDHGVGVSNSRSTVVNFVSILWNLGLVTGTFNIIDI